MACLGLRELRAGVKTRDSRNLRQTFSTIFTPPQLYVSQNQAEDKKRSVREQLLKAVSEQEKKSKLLKAEQTKVHTKKWVAPFDSGGIF